VSSPVGYALLRRKQFRQRARAEGGDGASLNDALLERKFLQQQHQLQELRQTRGLGGVDRNEAVSSPIGAMLLRRKMHRQRRSIENQQRDMGDLTDDSEGRQTPGSRLDDTDATTTDDDSGPAGSVGDQRRTGPPPSLQRIVVTTAPDAGDALRSFPAQVSSPFGTALLHRKRQARQRGFPMSLSDGANDGGSDSGSGVAGDQPGRPSPKIDTSSGRGAGSAGDRFFNPSVSSPFGAALRLRKRGQQAASKLTRGDLSGSPRALF